MMRTKKMINLLKTAIKNKHMYSLEEIEYMEQQLSFIENKVKEVQHKDYKGFGKK
jgi:predicted proteasome-type protease